MAITAEIKESHFAFICRLSLFRPLDLKI